MFRLFLVCCFVWSAAFSKAQFTTYKQLNYQLANVFCSGFDGEGNSYILSYWDLNNNSYKGKDLILTKYGPSGIFVWAKKYSQEKEFSTVDMDVTSNHVYFMGQTYTNGCTEKAFVVKLNTDGEIERAQEFNIDNRFMTGAITTISEDSEENIYFNVIGDDARCSGNDNTFLVSMDKNLNIRFAKFVTGQTGSYSFVRCVNDTLVMNFRFKGFYLFNKQGKFLSGFGLQNPGFTTDFEDNFERNGKIIQLAITTGLGAIYSYRFLEMNCNGLIYRESKQFSGKISYFTVDPFGTINIAVAVQGTGAASYTAYQQLDSNLNEIQTFTLHNDSLTSGRIVPFCTDHIKLYSRAKNLRVNEFDIYMPDPGPKILKIANKLLTDSPRYTKNALTLADNDVKWNQSAFPLVYNGDTAFAEELLYSYPECGNSKLLPDDTLVCDSAGLSLVLPDFSPELVCGVSTLEIEWNGQSGNHNFYVDQSGLTTVKVTQGPCVYEDSVSIVIDKTKWKNNPVYYPCFEENGLLKLSSGPEIHGKWDESQTDSLVIRKSGWYEYSGTTDLGCPYSDSVLVDEICDEMVYLPSSFTPDGDGINDFYLPVGAALQNWTMTVYDRWGLPIWTGNETTKGWDGRGETKQVSVGFYSYVLNYLTLDSKNSSRFGHIIIAR